LFESQVDVKLHAMTESQSKERDPPRTPEEFREQLFFVGGLYDPVLYPPDEFGVYEPGARHEAYCVDCRKERTFQLLDQPFLRDSAHRIVEVEFPSGTELREFRCAHNGDHFIVFAIRRCDGGEMKVGQWPSIADIALGKLGGFDSVMEKQDRADLGKAIGLFAHGAGAGAFVYLRRILERLVAEAEREAGRTPEHNKKVVDRIKELSGVLPQFLVDRPQLYGVLSKGVHELSEGRCLAAFPPVRSAIELIVRQKLAKKEQAALEARTHKELEALQRELDSSRVEPKANGGEQQPTNLSE